MRPDPDELGPDDRAFGRVVDVLDTLTDDDAALDEPPADLWAGIAAGMAAGSPTGAAAADRTATPVDGAVVVDLGSRRRQRWLRVAAAAAVVAIAAGTFGVVRSTSSGPDQELVASVDLLPLKDAGAGQARLIEVDGVERLEITAEGLPDAPGGHHYEMWLIDAGVTDPRSLGVLPPGQDRVVVDVPEGVDPDRYPIVDINVQVDGEEQHSGVETSVLRGSLA